MHLQLYDDDNNKVCDLVEGFRPFGYYSPLDGYDHFNFFSEMFARRVRFFIFIFCILTILLGFEN